MGEVFLGENLQLGRKEALKILMPTVAADPRFVSRFRREARAVNRLRHPNIISVYDFGQLQDQRFYLSMEYAEGENLFQMMRRVGDVEIPRALHLIGQLSYAVHHAHSRGVLHRDLKPGNLMVVGPTETLKVLDFGMAKIVAADHAESVALSTGNVIWGTAKYMAPERVTGTNTDPRTDLYAIGCIAFELLTGAAPFSGSANEILHAHLLMPPPLPSSRRSGIVPELDRVIVRCLEKKPEDRYQTAAELFAALHKVPGYPTSKPDSRRHFIAVSRVVTPQSFEQPRAQTEPDARDLRGALRGVAEALLDVGLTDTRLLSGVVYLRDHERSLERLEAAQDALEHEAAAVRETVGDREVSLRFALSELRFVAQQAEGTAPIHAIKIRELETRLTAAVADGDRLRGLEQGIAEVASVRADGLAKLKAAYEALEQVVDELLPGYDGHAGLEPAARRWVAARARRQGG
jgi:serine/threonine protein kinase